MKKIFLALLLPFAMATVHAQSCMDAALEYKQYLDNLMSLSSANSKRIDKQTVAREAQTKDNPQRYMDFMLIRYEHTEIFIQQNVYFQCIGASEELNPCASDPAIKDMIERFNGTAKLAEKRVKSLIKSRDAHMASFELKYGYPDFVEITNYLLKDEQELANKFGLIIE